MDSWQIVAHLVAKGDNVYASTSWAARPGFFPARHATRIEPLPETADESDVFQEKLQLLVAEGWRE